MDSYYDSYYFESTWSFDNLGLGIFDLKFSVFKVCSIFLKMDKKLIVYLQK